MQNFCTLYDESSHRSRKLFYIICKQLSQMGIIESDDWIDELSSVRGSYKRAFRDLVVQAMVAIKEKDIEARGLPASGPSSSDNIPQVGIVHAADSRDFLNADSATSLRGSDKIRDLSEVLDFRSSRYQDDFAEILPLGRGAFGQVWRVENKLDGMEYAIKKIRLRGEKSKKLEKILREVKFQARLTHPNVVRYYSAWLEHIDESAAMRGCVPDDGDALSPSSTGYSNTGTMTADPRLVEVSTGGEDNGNADEDSFQIEFTDSIGGANDDDDDDADESDEIGEDEDEDDDEDDDDADDDGSDDVTDSNPSSPSLSPSPKHGASSIPIPHARATPPPIHAATRPPRQLTLFIQMELCNITLQEWLNARNRSFFETGNSVDGRECLKIFKDVVEGLAYVHDMGCIHR
ncbi:kinase-like domain-containing protein [Blyttiomyces helicus]|uniref:non-specific serine/threonine protein kinase n=1 Tax=Blyttiomyces helicus TaxID=388810 RepID=A0A4P9VWG4_9FUNG|nr:kinase-like domain-containing protein [Blyttiomyces helicus]|eukprot:RKO84041.1 kinase-like domain-containing protein [Blyttiomyces helicus]